MLLRFTRRIQFAWILKFHMLYRVSMMEKSKFAYQQFSTLSLPRVINVNFPLQPQQKYYITQMKNLAFYNLLRLKMIILPIHTTSLIHFSLERLGKCSFLTWEWKGWKACVAERRICNSGVWCGVNLVECIGKTRLAGPVCTCPSLFHRQSLPGKSS